MKRAAAGMVAAVLTAAGLDGGPAALAHDPGAEPAPASPAPGPEAPGGAESRGTQAETTATPAPIVETQGRWHGSTLLFDQSATTQTLHLGGDYQSYNPTYELWVAFRPRFFLYESQTSAVSLNAWANAYLELTNSDTTTREREPLLGPTYLWATYARTFHQSSKETKTVLSIGPRALLPTDKAALGSGFLVGLGGLASASQYIGLRADGARLFKSARIGGGAVYNHPFVTATSTTNDNIKQVRQDVAGRTVVSDQLTGAMQVKHSLNLTASGDLRILPRWELSLSYIWLQAWAYAPPKAQLLLPTGPVGPMTVADPTTYRLSTWATASLTYEPDDAFAVSLGYYNLATQIGPDGTRRNPLWSPAARLFLTITGNLDVIYARYGGKGRPKS